MRIHTPIPELDLTVLRTARQAMAEDEGSHTRHRPIVNLNSGVPRTHFKRAKLQVAEATIRRSPRLLGRRDSVKAFCITTDCPCPRCFFLQ